MNSKRRILIVFCCLCIVCSAYAQQINIIPQPLKIVEQKGIFEFNDRTRLRLPDDEDYRRIAGFLIKSFQQAAGISIGIASKSSSNDVEFKKVKGMGPEAYKLIVTPDRITIMSTYPNGAFYALQTIYQLLPEYIYRPEKKEGVKWVVPCCEIEDSPRFSYRGMHLDVCSHFFDVDYIKRYIDLIAMHKQNVFHWHLTEDQGWRLEIKKYPQLTEKGSIRKETVIGTLASGVYDGTPYGGYYTQEQVREIVKYAGDRFITVLPEIEMPGHALAAISCFPELSCGLEDKYEPATRWGVFPQVYCPKETTFAFLEDILSEVFDLFPSPLIHIGGDECPKQSWKKCAHCQDMIKKLGLKDEFELQSYFIQRIEKFVNSKGRQIIGWDEILQGGLAPNATVMSWLGEEGGIKAAMQHHDAVMCPHQKYYLDYYQADPSTEKLAMGHYVPLKEVYDYNPVPDTLTAEEKKYITGVQGCVWTEYMKTPERVEYMAYPRALAICEAGWSHAENKNWDSFTHRLEKHFVRLDEKKVNYCRAFYDVEIKVGKDGPYSKVVSLSIDAPDTEIRYTTDGSEPTLSSPLYKMPFVINPSETVKAGGFRGSACTGKITSKGFN
ncbi:MAG: family 20 glycosylhydrolase [Dysgonamonadaceae bacterium]|jgi:hexosaminidase|nr:family 20 glycosylhydrolase [Dysgonamonadaceae bacterium]